MTANGLQEGVIETGVIETGVIETLAALHDATSRMSAAARQRFAGDWRAGLAPAARARATVAAMTVSTQLMETMSWLLVRQGVVLGELSEPPPTLWRARAADPDALAGESAVLARAVDQLYQHIRELAR